MQPSPRTIITGLTSLALITLTIHLSGPNLSTMEERLVGRWRTAHGNVDTQLELRADRSVSVDQQVRLASVRNAQPVTTRTHGRWRVENGRLLVETWPENNPPTLLSRVRTFVRTQRWPARGCLQRDWRLEALAPDRFAFVDASGQRGRAVKEIVWRAVQHASTSTDAALASAPSPP